MGFETGFVDSDGVKIESSEHLFSDHVACRSPWKVYFGNAKDKWFVLGLHNNYEIPLDVFLDDYAPVTHKEDRRICDRRGRND